MFNRSTAALRIASVFAVVLGVQTTYTQQQQPAPPPPGASVREPATVVPIQVTGDAASRFTLVVLADGYAAADLPKFRQDLDKHLNILWSIALFGTTVGQDATISGTTSPLAPLLIGNTLRGALNCASNASAPETAGSKNTAKSATGQCAGV